MSYPALQNVLNGGEISPLLYARIDQPRYRTGAYIMRNAVPLPQGGATRRPGTVFCGYAAEEEAAGGQVRLEPFIFAEDQARMLEFAPGVMRIWLANGTRALGADGVPISVPLPYEAEDIPLLQFAQSADVMYIACLNRPPAKISRYADDDWRYEALGFVSKTPAPGAPVLETGGGVAGSGTQTYSYKVVAMNGDTGELSPPSEAVDISCSSLSQTYYITVSWEPVEGCTEYRIYKKRAGIYGFIGRALDGEVSFKDNNIAPDLADSPAEDKSPFNGPGAYPGLVFFHQQRLGWAASRQKPLTVWLSQSANFESLASGLNPRDDDGIEATIAGQNQSRILWLKPDKDALLIGTGNGEWSLQAAEGSVLTPSNLCFLPQSEIGSANSLGALRAGTGVLFVQRGGNAVRMMGYVFQSDKYEPQDLSILARHLLEGRTVTSWARQSEPYGVIWMSLSDGTMAGLTLLHEHDVVGWHRHDTAGHIEQVAVLPSADGQQDLLWMLVRRTVNGRKRRFVEVMAPYFDGEDRELAYHLDAGTTRISGPERNLGGLAHLEGESVHLFTDGYVMPARTVESGEVELDHPVRVAHGGLPFVMEIHPTRPEVALQEGASIGRVRRISQVLLRVHRSLSFSVRLQADESGSGLSDRLFRKQTAFPNLAAHPLNRQPRFLETGDVSVPLGGGWQKDARLVIEASDPVPVTLLAIVCVVEVSPGYGTH